MDYGARLKIVQNQLTHTLFKGEINMEEKQTWITEVYQEFWDTAL